MPLYKQLKADRNTEIFVWKITETEEELQHQAPMQDKHQARYQGMLSVQHRKGFLSVRQLLKKAGYSDFDLNYDEHGKPHLSDGKSISITHSFEFSAIIVSTKNVGIDIEKQREKIIRIADKFIGSEYDYLSTDGDYIQKLSVIWGAKESMYKMCNSRSLSFKNNMHVAPFTLNQNHGKAKVGCVELDFEKQFKFFFESFENFTLVYTLADE